MMRYPDLQISGELRRRVEESSRWLQLCIVCPHECGTDRTKEAGAFCLARDRIRLVSFGPHFGEEGPLVGRGGSGTIFFGRCNLRCVYCQNYDISQADSGRIISAHELADIMLQIQGMGCENINFVSPTHFTPQILEAIDLAAKQGLQLPLVWNTGTFERHETLRLLDGVVDIYLPDTKYADPQVAHRLSGITDYPQRMREALREMHRQVGVLITDECGVAVRGLLVRHLVLPAGLAGTADTLHFVSKELSPDTYVNVMGQYRPEYRAQEYPEIARPVTVEEVTEGRHLARQAGLQRLDC